MLGIFMEILKFLDLALDSLHFWHEFKMKMLLQMYGDGDSSI